MDIIIVIVILLFSVVLHELSHGVVADKLGDHTARYAGRLTLNPLPHLDPIASVILPLFLLSVHSPVMFAAAKPVPVNFFNLRHPRRDMALVSLAGVGANFLLAIAFALPIRLGLLTEGSSAYDIFISVVLMNLGLGIFNLLPIPPLDGSKVLASLFSDEWMYKILSLERFGFILIIFFLYTGVIHRIVVPILAAASQFLLGFSIL